MSPSGMRRACSGWRVVKPVSDKQRAKRLAAGERFIGSSIAPKPVQPQPSSGYCPIRRKTKKRKPSEFARIYHSKERVTWVKSLGCFFAPSGECVGPIDNAHTESGKGTGYKAGYEVIVAACRKHHQQFDQRQAQFAIASVRAKVRQLAADTEKAWQECCSPTAHNSRG